MLLLFFVVTVTLVNFITIRDENVRNIGLVLAVGCLASNLVAHGEQETRAGVYSMIEIMVMATTFVSYTFAPELPGRVLLRVLAAVSLLSVCINVAYLGVLPATTSQQNLYDIVTNVCFFIECVLAGVTGVLVGVGSGRFNFSPRSGRVRARSHDATNRIDPS